MTDVYDDLMLAADLIQERGWATARTENVDLERAWFPRPSDTGPLCLEGGLNAACQNDMFGDGNREPHLHLAQYLGVAEHRLYRWNDTPGRTATEVIETLRAAAATSLAKDAAVAAREHAAEGVSA